MFHQTELQVGRAVAVQTYEIVAVAVVVVIGVMLQGVAIITTWPRSEWGYRA